MISKKETKDANANQPDSIIPISWKLWVLVFKSIAEGHLTELEKQVLPVCEEDILNGSIQDITFPDAILGLYIESCEDTCRELPTGIYNLERPGDALLAISNTAQEVLSWYKKAIPYIDSSSEYAESFETIAENCRIIIQLIDYKPDKPRNESEFFSDGLRYFSHLDMQPWHRIVVGKCIEDISYDDFSNILNCEGVVNWIEESEDDEDGIICGKDYSDLKLKPIIGYGMAIYAFLQLLLVHRKLHEYPLESIDDDGEFYVTGVETDDKYQWADKFESRIDWGDNYSIREDSWKTGYFSSDERPSSIGSEVTKEDRNLLKSLCQRLTFEDIVSSDSLQFVLGGAIFTTLGFEQYKYIHDNLNNLDTLHRLLIQELEYLYDNGDDIADCFEERAHAERQHDDYSKWRYEAKQENNNAIIQLCNKQITGGDIDSIHRILFTRRLYAYEYLWQQPVIYSEIVKEYLQKCVIQDEVLLLAVKRSLEDTPLQRSLSKMASGKVKRNLRVEEAVQVLREEGVIDEQSNILPIVPGGKKYKTLDLIRILVGARPSGQKEFARPKGGWKYFITRQKTETVPARLIGRDGKFIEDFYGELWRFDLDFINGIDWNLFNGVFTLKGKPLSGDDLCNVFKNKKEYRIEVIEPLIRKYENETDDSFVRLRK